MKIEEFALPDVGEGLREAEIVTWRVAVGDVVEVNQALVEIETAKSLVELPSPYTGEVAELLAAEGTTVDVGRAIIRIRTTTGSEEQPDPPLLVGYGPSASTRRRSRPNPPVIMQSSGQEPPVSQPPVSRPPVSRPPVSRPPVSRPPIARPRAKPPVRKLAKDLGIDLAGLLPSGPGGIITRDDVRNANQPKPPGDHAVAEAIRIPIRGVRKATAAAMVASAFTAPHVTEFLTVDVSRTMDLRDQVVKRPEFAAVKLSPLVLVARALLVALRRTPEANARWDGEAGEIIQFRAVNLGIAAATQRGLVVPNIKDAQQLSLAELATGINDLAATARAGTTTPLALTGGTITITNVGMFGVDTGTPILNPGEAAILALGAIRRMPWVVDEGGQEHIEPRWVTQLALSFDHRILDGAQGSRLLADLGAILHEPGLALL